MNKILLLMVLFLAGCSAKPEPIITTVEVVKPVFTVPPALLAIQIPDKPNLAIYEVKAETANDELLKASYISIRQLQIYSKSLKDTLDAYNRVLRVDKLPQKKD